MRIAVIGLGGVGGYFGGKLARAYAGTGRHEVIFVARGKHLAAIREKGLLVKTVEETFTCTPDLATDSLEDVGKVDLVLFCVKSYDLESAALALKPVADPDTYILPVLNGVEIAERIENVLHTGIVLEGCTYITSNIEAPGVIKQNGGTCQLLFGKEGYSLEQLRQLEEILQGAAIKASLVPDITNAVWTKFVRICGMAGATAYYQVPIGAILDDPQKVATLKALVREAVNVAKAKGVNLPDSIVEEIEETNRQFPYHAKSSLQLDLEANRRSELNGLCGTVVSIGKRLNVPTPCTTMVYEAIKARTSE